MGRLPRSTKKTTNPDIVLDLVWRDRCFFFALRNISERSVRDVKIAFRRKVIGMGGGVDIARLPIWTQLLFVPPGKEIEVTVDRDTTFFAHNNTGPLAVSITYTDADGITWRAQIMHDFSAYKDFPDLRIS